MVADARKLKSLAAAEGIDLNYYQYAGMVHAWMFLNLPESKKARKIGSARELGWAGSLTRI